ncbi:CHAD domain-containing protein [Agromyces sp. Marseille-Q5079]|uniref:CHAD domain-containing protein n=1 Tax=Agromyces sp. Marseille-Q5079 TaxID=3439059 RepID=UPI003D9C82B8
MVGDARADDAAIDAGTAVIAALGAAGARMRGLEASARADEPDAVHQLRTHVRRVRSLLAAYAPVFDAAPALALRRRFGEFGTELGVVRDIEVRMQVAERALEEASDRGLIDDEAHLRLVRSRLVDAERLEYRLAHAWWLERQALPRAAARRDAFDAAPPLAPAAADPASDVLAACIEREARRTVRRARRVEGADTESLHAVRKAGRRLRYAAEAVSTEPVALFDGRVRAFAEIGDDLHDVLGDHRDEVLFADHVRRAGAHVAHEGGASLVFDRLAEAAEERAAGHLRRLPAVIAELRALVED